MKKLAFTFFEESLKIAQNDWEVIKAFEEEGVQRIEHDTYAMSFPDEADYEESAKEVEQFLSRFGFEEGSDYTL